MVVPPPLLVVDIGRILFIGAVEHVPLHKPMVPIFGAGVDGHFGLEIDGRSSSVRTAIVNAHVAREVHAGGGALAVMPIDPAILRHGEVDDEPGALAALGELQRNYTPVAWRELALAVGLREVQGDMPRSVASATELLSASAADNEPIEEVARTVGLSVSHLQHLFKLHVGTSMRTYRVWKRMAGVAAWMKAGRTLTEASIAVGFFDSAHFSSTFRRTFGVTPSFVFTPELRIHVV